MNSSYKYLSRFFLIVSIVDHKLDMQILWISIKWTSSCSNMFLVIMLLKFLLWFERCAAFFTFVFVGLRRHQYFLTLTIIYVFTRIFQNVRCQIHRIYSSRCYRNIQANWRNILVDVVMVSESDSIIMSIKTFYCVWK